MPRDIYDHLEDWRDVAEGNVDMIGSWRTAIPELAELREEDDRQGLPVNLELHLWELEAKVENYWTTSGMSEGELDSFMWDTKAIYDYIVEHFPRLDPAPLLKLHAAIKAWHEDRSDARVPHQGDLRTAFEHAMFLYCTIHTHLYRQGVEAKSVAAPGAAVPAKIEADADGPQPPNYFFIRGNRHEMQPRLWKLLNYLWNQDKPVSFTEAEETVWRSRDRDEVEVKDTAIKSAVSRLNKFLLECGANVTFTTRQSYILKDNPKT